MPSGNLQKENSSAKLKVACIIFLLVGVVLLLYSYFFVVPTEKEFIISIDWDSAPVGWVLSNPSAVRLEVQVKGSRFAMAILEDHLPQYIPTWNDMAQGRMALPVSAGDITLPDSVKVLTVSPALLNFTTEKEVESECFVVVPLVGNPAVGYTVTEWLAEPQRIRVRGPESSVEKLTVISTLPVDITGAKDSIRKQVIPNIPDFFEVVSPPHPLDAIIVVEEENVVRKFLDVPVLGRHSARIYDIRPDSIDLKVKGPLQVLNEFSMERDLHVYINLCGLSSGVFVRRARIELPVELTLLDSTPEVFTIDVK